MMYLGTVKYPNSTLSGTLADSKLFSKEVQLRVKCVLQVFIALITVTHSMVMKAPGFLMSNPAQIFRGDSSDHP